MRLNICFLLSICLLAFTVACNKKNSTPKTSMPEELVNLKGKWRLVSYNHITIAGTNTNHPPLFNKMEFDSKTLAIYFDDKQIKKDRFSFVKDESVNLYILSFAGKINQFYLYHYVDFVSDILCLRSTLIDAGTAYFLVKE